MAEEKPAPSKQAPKPPAVMATTPWEGGLAEELKNRFGAQIGQTASYLGQNFVAAQPEAVVPILEYLKFECAFDYLVDITAVDWPQRAERFDLVYILYSFARNERLRIKTQISEDCRPGSAVGVHWTANWLEREVFDMFGIEFAGHPDLRRILLPEGWNGHPLRKDYDILQPDAAWVRANLHLEGEE
jgi:NADH-quinone oxidoreductase subunit C